MCTCAWNGSGWQGLPRLGTPCFPYLLEILKRERLACGMGQIDLHNRLRVTGLVQQWQGVRINSQGW
jgi:hypothetical protein